MTPVNSSIIGIPEIPDSGSDFSNWTSPHDIELNYKKEIILHNQWMKIQHWL